MKGTRIYLIILKNPPLPSPTARLLYFLICNANNSLSGVWEQTAQKTAEWTQPTPLDLQKKTDRQTDEEKMVQLISLPHDTVCLYFNPAMTVKVQAYTNTVLGQNIFTIHKSDELENGHEKTLRNALDQATA